MSAPAIANLNDTREAQAQAKKAHPAGTAKKAAPAKAAAKPELPAEAKADQPAKLKLAYPDGRDDRATTGRTAAAGDRTYALVPDGEKWKATMTVGKKVTVLAEGVSINAGYAAVVKHANAQAS